jgi:hypothetical protein
MFKFLHNTKWKKSEAHLLFLSKFLTGVNTENSSAGLSFWQEVLGEPASVVIDRWIKQNILVKAQASMALEKLFSSKELKSLCKNYQLPISGTKAKLIEQLLNNPIENIESIVQRCEVYCCSSDSADIANSYLLKAKQDKSEAELLSFQYLVKNNLTEAASAMAAYEQKQVFPRGMGVDWKSHDVTTDVEELKLIMQNTPAILKDMKPQVLNNIRVAAAMARLFSTSSAKKWMPKEITTEIHLLPDEASRMLIFYAKNKVQIKQAIQFGATHVELKVGTQAPCDACKQVENKIFPVTSVPEIPLGDCKFERGSVIIAYPIFN